MRLDVVKDKEIYQKHLQKHKRFLQRKRRIWEVTLQFLQTQEKAHACAKFYGNIKEKCVESKTKMHVSEPMASTIGVKQTCPLSPERDEML